MSNSRKTSRFAAAAAVAVCAVMAFAALGGVGLAQTSGNPGKGQYGKKVTICHKGKKTITIAKAALPAHLRHGDQVGTCAAVAAKAKKAKAAKAKAAAAKAKAAAAKAKAAEKKAEQSSQEKPGKGKGRGK